jgi:exonuclease I
MSLKVGVIVEGESDFEILRKIEGLELGRKDLRSVGKEPSPEKVRAYARILKSENKEKVILLKDLNCQEYEKAMQKYSGISEVNEVCIVIHEIEGWLLADEEALAKVLRVKKVESLANPEEIHDPKRKLIELFKRYKGREYKETMDGPRIAQHLRIEKAKRCKSFENFLKALKN